MGCCYTTQATRPPHYNKPLVRMCSSGNHFSNFVDIGDTVVLFVDFGNDFKPVPRLNLEHSLGGATAGPAWPNRRHLEPEQFEIKLAGLQAFLKKLKPKDDDCKSFRAEARILMTDKVLENPGGLVTFMVPYSNNEGEYLGMVTEKDIEFDTEHRVYHYPLWDELIDHNQEIREEIRHRASSKMVETTYGSMGRQRRSLLGSEAPRDQVDAATASTSAQVLTATDEHVRLLQNQRCAKRYWPDTWEMSWWRRACCDPIMRSQNCFTRFWAMFFVAPIVHVTGLSLYYQLYLTEIFHLKFMTKLGHYIFMPLIVMMMMAFFAQWRFFGCYNLANTEVLVLNGTAVMAYVFLLWYTIWGLIQKTPCMGVFMIIPMGILYILANITFQMAVKNSLQDHVSCTKCWDHTKHFSHLKYFNAFKLIHWYYNPIVWVFVLSFFQALSHIFEPKIPPRVNQTAHWMSCTDMFKKYGYSKSFVIFLAQAIFGTIDEFLASPRLLPLLALRICFNLGYQPKEWEVLQILVKKSLQYGDPALDYIGTGGAEYLPEDSVIPETSLSDSGSDKLPVDHADNIGYNIGKLKRHLNEMDKTLTAEQKEKLSDPRKLIHERDDWLEHYIVVQHYIAKYELQVHAYGPFRTNEQEDEAERDNSRMERDFPMKKHSSFRNFLREVRFHLWLMEDEMIERRALSACCANEL